MPIKAERSREVWQTTLNSFDRGLGPMSRCENIGIGGACGLRCAAFCDGECDEPYVFTLEDVTKEFDEEELEEILGYYPKFLEKGE